MELSYTCLSVKNERLLISLELKDIPLHQALSLYKGQLSLTHISITESFTETAEEIKVMHPANKTITITYEVEIGKLSKHGHAGYINESEICFSGEHYFLVPLEMITSLTPPVEKITLDFSELNSKHHVLPFETCQLNNPTWWDIYDLMKSCYLFTNEMQHRTSAPHSNVHFWFAPTFSEENVQDIMQHSMQLYTYYAHVFSKGIPALTLCFFNNDKEILGGASRQMIGASFSCLNVRDWQLLSHRMYHAFMDHHILIPKLHIPPHVWLTEGLASLYELKALNQLDEAWKEKVGFCYQKHLDQLAVRYLYFSCKDVRRLNVALMFEHRIKSKGIIEFIHYTKAPMLVLYLEAMFMKRGFSEHQMIVDLIKHQHQPFDLKAYFDSWLGALSDDFASKYLFGTELIPVWTFLPSSELSDVDVIQLLNEYEATLYSWFNLEEATYCQELISLEHLNELSIIAKRRGIQIAPKGLDASILRFSPIAHQLLIVYYLRLLILGIHPHDVGIRFMVFENPIQLKRWQQFKDLVLMN